MLRSAGWGGLVAVLTVGVAMSGCDTGDGSADSPRSTENPVIDAGDGGDYRPTLDPAQFVDGTDNPYFPLELGTRWVYEGVVDGERERIELEVTAATKHILGIAAVGVRDVNYVDGALAAATMDWYAEDRSGNVWYLGEDTQNFANGEPTDTEGWQAGVDGALPGIFMLAEPTPGAAYWQNHHAGAVEDLAEVVRLGVTLSLGVGEYHNVIIVRGWSPLEPEIIEEKYYAPGVGKIYEIQIAGGDGGTELVEHATAVGLSE